jgi:hypothetical protein
VANGRGRLYDPFVGKGARIISGLYYGVLGLLMLLAVTGRAGDVFPGTIGTHVGDDSEGILLALGLAAWVQFVRPRLAGTRREWPLTALAVAVLAILGFWMYVTGPLPGNVETLNEPLFALAILTFYVQMRRPLPRPLVGVVIVASLLVFVTASAWQASTSLAELLAMLVLIPIGLDVVDRAILDPQAPTSSTVRWAWYVWLLAVPISIATVFAGAFTGALGDALTYLSRVQEAWLGVLLVELYFAVGHGRVGPRAVTSSAGERVPQRGGARPASA